jgi:hypothetical protein
LWSEVGGISHLSEDVIEEESEFLAVEVAASVSVVLLENLFNELLKFLISNHIHVINILDRIN